MILNKRVPFTLLLRKIKFQLPVIFGYSILVEILDEFYHIKNMSMPLNIPTFLGTTISLVLAFRTGQAYNRWWEARKVWGAIVNDSRSLVRQIYTLTLRQTDEQFEQVQKNFAYRQMAWVHALGQALRGILDKEALRKYLPENEWEFVTKQKNIPNAILQIHSQQLQQAAKQGWYEPNQQVCIETTISRLCDSMGKCERIKNTVFPRIYSVFVHIMLYTFLLLLPFGLIDYFGYIEALIIVTLTTPFFMLEKAAIVMQDPFENSVHDVPVTALAQTIELNLRQMLEEDFVPEPAKDYGYYVL
ncbi:MAG: bestrophin family ion channel [Spirochaetota bacterium]